MNHLQLAASPWALQRELMPVLSNIAMRRVSGLPMSDDDRAQVQAGQEQWAARRTAPGGFGGQSAEGGIALIGVYGIILPRGGMADLSTPAASAMQLTAQVRSAAADSSVSGIVLDIDSPGGSVYGIQELGDAIHAAHLQKPVVAVANALAASAAYWIASQAGEFYAAPGAEVGSIGVYTAHQDMSGALEQAGVKVQLISAGKYKTETSPYGPLSDTARAATQATVDGYYATFVSAVSRGRNVSQTAVRAGMGQGRLLLPDDAKACGMIDGTMTLSQVVAMMQSKLQRRGARTPTGNADFPARARALAAIRAIERRDLISRLEGLGA